MNSKYYQCGNYKKYLKNPQKCKSDVVTVRSSWEAHFILKYLDVNENIIEWESEVPIKYLCHTDGKYHRYFIDFSMIVKTKDNKTKKILVEIKPYSECNPPKEPKKKTKNYIYAVNTWIKNKSKWDTARMLCESAKQRGEDIDFVIISERDCPWFLKK